MQRIERDRSRFRQIVRGHVKKDLRKYMSQRELIGRQGKRLVSIPLPQIELPRFRYGAKQAGGVGQGDGDPGDRIGRGDPQPGSGQAGDKPVVAGCQIPLPPRPPSSALVTRTRVSLGTVLTA